MVALTIAAMGPALTLISQVDFPADRNENYRSQYDLPVGKHYTGRSPYMGRMAKLSAPTPGPAPVVKSEAAPASEFVASAAPRKVTQPNPASAAKPALASGGSKPSYTETTAGLVKLSKTLPADAILGSEYVEELTITAQGCAANVVVRDGIPTGATYVRSEPAATVEGDQLVWKIGNLDAGQVIKAKIWFKADREGALANCAVVTADPRVCGSVFVGKPILTIDKSGPESGLLGQDVTYNLVVRNTGSAVVKNVVVTDPVPPGMSHQSGKTELSFEVGDLAPGQAKPLTVTFKANQRGKVCNTATATSANAPKVSKETCTVILVPGLKVEKTGTKEQILGRNADYEIVVTNTGDTALNNVTVTDIAPGETSIVAAPGANISGNRATWTIAELKAGGKTTQSIKLTSKTAGTHCNNVTASSGTVSDSAKTCTLWKGIPAVALEVTDDPDPIQVGESTTYTIKVTNQGFADIHNVKIVASYGDQIVPVSSVLGAVSGQTVTFPKVATLAGKQSVTYTIIVKGASVGDSRNKVSLTADELKSPVAVEESTTIY